MEVFCLNQGLLYHRTYKPDFLSYWPSLIKFLSKKGEISDEVLYP